MNSVAAGRARPVFFTDDFGDQVRLCHRCGQFVVEAIGFHRSTRSKTGIQSYCKRCLSRAARLNEPGYIEDIKRCQASEVQKGRRRAHAQQRRVDDYDRVRRVEIAATKRRAERHPELVSLQARVRRSRRRERIKVAGGTHTVADVQRKLAQQGGRCYWCQTELNGAYHVDHIIPIGRGGTNAANNICAACAPCNWRKHQKMPSEFIGRLL